MDVRLILTLLGAVAVTAICLYVFAPAAPFFRLIDQPDATRKLHTGNVPLTGGVSLYLALCAVFYISGLASHSLTATADFWPVVTATCATLVMLHAVDDVVELRPETRIAMDAVLAFFICMYAMVRLTTLGPLFGMGEVTLGHYSIAMTIFCFVAASNAFNMVDGLDSLCSGLGMVALLTLVAFILMGGAPADEHLVDVALVVVAALGTAYAANLGMPGRAMRVFLGDSGARLIAFIVSMALILAAQKKLIHPVMAYFPIAIPVNDCLVLMGTRMLRGRSPVSGDRLHLHHLLQNLGYSSMQTRRFILVLAVMVALCGVLFQALQPPDWVVSAFVVGSFWVYIGFRIWLMRLGARRAAALTAAEVPPEASAPVGPGLTSEIP